MNAPLKEGMNLLVGIFLKIWPNFLNVSLQLGKELFWKDALSIISTYFGSGHFLQCWRSCSINDANKMPSVEFLKIRDKG